MRLDSEVSSSSMVYDSFQKQYPTPYLLILKLRTGKHNIDSNITFYFYHVRSELNLTFSQKCKIQVTSAEVSRPLTLGTVDNNCCVIISQSQKRGRVKKAK